MEYRIPPAESHSPRPAQERSNDSYEKNQIQNRVPRGGVAQASWLASGKRADRPVFPSRRRSSGVSLASSGACAKRQSALGAVLANHRAVALFQTKASREIR